MRRLPGSRALSSALILNAWLAMPASASPPLVFDVAETVPPEEQATLVFSAGPDLGRTFRGDWESPDALLMVYDEAWRETLVSLIDGAAGQAEVYVLTGQATSSDVDLWVRTLARGLGVPHGIRHLDVPTDSAWVRDYGPLQVRERDRALWLDPLYADHRPLDDLVPDHLAADFAAPLEAVGLRLDGGAVVGNGAGLCAMTWTSIEDLGVQPGTMQLGELLERLGCDVLAVLPSLLGEETGHVDLFVRFFAPDIVGVASMDPVYFPDNAARLDEAVAGLLAAAAELDTRLRIVRIPMPVTDDGQLLSYLNAVRVGDRLLTPSFAGVDVETEAAIYMSLVGASGLEIVPIPTDGPMSAGGAIHCLALGLFLPPAFGVEGVYLAQLRSTTGEEPLGRPTRRWHVPEQLSCD